MVPPRPLIDKGHAIFVPTLLLILFMNTTRFQEPQIKTGITIQHMTCTELLNMCMSYVSLDIASGTSWFPGSLD